jgi:hypothetical protein
MPKVPKIQKLPKLIATNNRKARVGTFGDF